MVGLLLNNLISLVGQDNFILIDIVFPTTPNILEDLDKLLKGMLFDVLPSGLDKTKISDLVLDIPPPLNLLEGWEKFLI